MTTYDAAIIGGGLAGLVAAVRIHHRRPNANVILIDDSIPQNDSTLGGFAHFSGAKFSLYPAGRGLAKIAGGDEQLKHTYLDLLNFLSMAGIPRLRGDETLFGAQHSVNQNLAYREYTSILLLQSEISKLIHYLANNAPNCEFEWEKVQALEIRHDGPCLLHTASDAPIRARRVIVAAGRLGARLLQNAGIPESSGKGIDLGVRLEFDSGAPLERLRNLGPDAKFISNNVRTFCLNSPGKIFPYPDLGILIPGGVVAEDGSIAANVGVLRRMPDKHKTLDLFRARSSEILAPHVQHWTYADTPEIGSYTPIPDLFPAGVAQELTDFAHRLTETGLIHWPNRFRIHYPLLDWHWPVFAKPRSFETATPSIFAIGDLSGHARGLLQACASGWLVAEEAFPS